MATNVTNEGQLSVVGVGWGLFFRALFHREGVRRDAGLSPPDEEGSRVIDQSGSKRIRMKYSEIINSNPHSINNELKKKNIKLNKKKKIEW